MNARGEIKMEKKKPEAADPQTIVRASAGSPDDTTDRIVAMIREMPRIDPPPELVSFVMEAVRAKKVSTWSRVRRWATLPRSINWTPVRLVFATAFSVLLVFSAALVHKSVNRGVALNDSRESIPVVLALEVPNANEVHVVGSFNNWVPQPCELHKEDGSARWTITLKLKPGRYEYAFLVDGRHMPHPGAELSQDDGFGNKNTVLALEREDDV